MRATLTTILGFLLLLTAVSYGKSFVTGDVIEVQKDYFRIRARFRPSVRFDPAPKAKYYCDGRVAAYDALREGDRVKVEFELEHDKWIAKKITMYTSEDDCRSRTR